MALPNKARRRILETELFGINCWLRDLATKGFSLRGGCIATELARKAEIENELGRTAGENRN